MKENKIKAPIKLLISITDRGEAKEVENYLSSRNLNTGIVFMGKGTAETSLGDIFGFGISDKDVLAVLIPVSKEKEIIHDINDITGIEKDKYGLTFVMPIQSAGSDLLEILGVKVGE